MPYVDALGPRIVIAGTGSGVGKTTVATGIMAALARCGLRVGGAKVGPDFIDPGYHAAAIGRPSRNLDLWMSGADVVASIAARAAAGCDVLVIEGVMGLFDGAADTTASSTADVAALLDAPVVLVVDAAAMGQSVAALVQGFATFEARVRIAGVVLNRVGSESHEAMLRAALAPSSIPIVGVVHRDGALRWRDRHLGLVPVVEQRTEVSAAIDRLAALVTARCDLDALLRIARTAPRRDGRPHTGPVEEPATPSAPGLGAPPVPRTADGPRITGESARPAADGLQADPATPHPVRIAVAAGRAFSFAYPDNLEALRAAGAELVEVDPLHDPALPPDVHGLVAGGGFPEVYAAELAANEPLLADLRRRGPDLVIWAECGGLLWLAGALDEHPMAGLVPTRGRMTERLTLGYRRATTTDATPLGPAGTELRGHEFHYSTTEPAGTLLSLIGRHGTSDGGFGHSRLFASYLHLHLAARPDLAGSFVETCRALRLPYAG